MRAPNFSAACARRVWLGLSITVAITACDGASPTAPEDPQAPPQSAPPTQPPPPQPSVPGRVLLIAAVTGDAQTATVNSELPIAPTAIVTDASGAPVPGVEVIFEIVAGSGTVSGGAPRAVVTGSDGTAAVTWTIGTAAGTNVLRAVVTGESRRSVEFRAQARPGPATRFIYAGGTRMAPVATTVSSAPGVFAVDAYGNHVSGVVVSFVVADDGAVLTGTERITDMHGFAQAESWTLGSRVGTYTVTASAQGVTPFVFTARAVAGPPANVEIVEGDGQTATVGTLVAIRPAVRIVDRFGNPVRGAFVTFHSGPGQDIPFHSRAHLTDEQGLARVEEWRLGTRPGQYTLAARAYTLARTFEATAVVGAPVRLRIHEGNLQAGGPNNTLPVAPAVRLVDVYGNIIHKAGVPVTFRVTAGGGSVTNGSVVTDGDGIARVGSWTLGPGGPLPGTGIIVGLINKLLAESPGLVPAEFSAIIR